MHRFMRSPSTSSSKYGVEESLELDDLAFFTGFAPTETRSTFSGSGSLGKGLFR
jgi:hypothetical protein